MLTPTPKRLADGFRKERDRERQRKEACGFRKGKLRLPLNLAARSREMQRKSWCPRLRTDFSRSDAFVRRARGVMLNLLAVSAAAWSPRPLVRPGRTLTPPSDNGLLGHPGGSDLSRQWLLQELASELLTEERAPSKQSGGDVRHTRSFPYMTRIGPVHDTYLRSFPYVSTVATPTRSAPCRMMARGKPAATTRQASRRSSSNPEVEAAQPVAAMLQGVATIVSATGAAAGALLCRQAGGAATGSWLSGGCVHEVNPQAAPGSISRLGRTGRLHSPRFPLRRLGYCWVREPRHRCVRRSVRCSHRCVRRLGLTPLA